VVDASRDDALDENLTVRAELEADLRSRADALVPGY
jgi:hypothetical protein